MNTDVKAVWQGTRFYLRIEALVRSRGNRVTLDTWYIGLVTLSRSLLGWFPFILRNIMTCCLWRDTSYRKTSTNTQSTYVKVPDQRVAKREAGLKHEEP